MGTKCVPKQNLKKSHAVGKEKRPETVWCIVTFFGQKTNITAINHIISILHFWECMLSTAISCFLPVHLTYDKQETSLKKKDGSHNEQYYKWQFLNCFVESGLCSKDYIGVEVQFPKGNKNAASIKLDSAIFDDKNWFSHYKALHTKKDDSKWDELNWLKEHLLCGIEFKKEGSKDIITVNL